MAENNTAKANGTEEQKDQVQYDIKLVTEDHFTKVLEEQFGNHKITKCEVKRALKNGENFGSLMLRVNIEIEKSDGKTDEAHYIAKLMPLYSQGDFIKKVKAFPREVEMYEKIYPRLEDLLRKNDVDVRFGPKFFASFEKPELMIMEDLTRSNFKNIKRQDGMDSTHVMATLSKLAKMHAASACIYENDGPFSQILTEGVYNTELTPLWDQIQPLVWSAMMKFLREWDTCQEYFDRIEGFLPRLVELNSKSIETDPDAFNVLNHGDLWSNNIMFKYTETGEIQDVYLLDLQISKWGSPAQDLQYFLISSPATDIKVKEFDYFVKFYHDELIKNLKCLNYGKTLPKLVDLHIDILNRGIFGVFTAFGVMSAVLVEQRDDATTENFFQETEESDALKRSLYTNSNFKAAVQSLLPFFDNRGLLDL